MDKKFIPTFEMFLNDNDSDVVMSIKGARKFTPEQFAYVEMKMVSEKLEKEIYTLEQKDKICCKRMALEELKKRNENSSGSSILVEIEKREQNIAGVSKDITIIKQAVDIDTDILETIVQSMDSLTVENTREETEDDKKFIDAYLFTLEKIVEAVDFCVDNTSENCALLSLDKMAYLETVIRSFSSDWEDDAKDGIPDELYFKIKECVRKAFAHCEFMKDNKDDVKNYHEHSSVIMESLNGSLCVANSEVDNGTNVSENNGMAIKNVEDSLDLKMETEDTEECVSIQRTNNFELSTEEDNTIGLYCHNQKEKLSGLLEIYDNPQCHMSNVTMDDDPHPSVENFKNRRSSSPIKKLPSNCKFSSECASTQPQSLAENVQNIKKEVEDNAPDKPKKGSGRRRAMTGGGNLVSALHKTKLCQMAADLVVSNNTTRGRRKRVMTDLKSLCQSTEKPNSNYSTESASTQPHAGSETVKIIKKEVEHTPDAPDKPKKGSGRRRAMTGGGNFVSALHTKVYQIAADLVVSNNTTRGRRPRIMTDLKSVYRSTEKPNINYSTESASTQPNAGSETVQTIKKEVEHTPDAPDKPKKGSGRRRAMTGGGTLVSALHKTKVCQMAPDLVVSNNTMRGRRPRAMTDLKSFSQPPTNKPNTNYSTESASTQSHAGSESVKTIKKEVEHNAPDRPKKGSGRRRAMTGGGNLVSALHKTKLCQMAADLVVSNNTTRGRRPRAMTDLKSFSQPPTNKTNIAKKYTTSNAQKVGVKTISITRSRTGTISCSRKTHISHSQKTPNPSPQRKATKTFVTPNSLPRKSTHDQNMSMSQRSDASFDSVRSTRSTRFSNQKSDGFATPNPAKPKSCPRNYKSSQDLGKTPKPSFTFVQRKDLPATESDIFEKLTTPERPVDLPKRACRGRNSSVSK